MSRRRLAGLAAAALLTAGLGCGDAGPAPGPARIVLVTIDTLRADHVGVYGAELPATPHLDALAEAGVVFRNALAPTPLTLPSHATLLTGLDPPAHGVHHNGVYTLGADLPLLPEALARTGRATGGFVGAVVLDRQYGLARGFDHYGDHMGLRRASATGYPERRAAEVVSEALEWALSTDGRFFLWVHLYDPHADYDAPAPFAGLYRDPYVAEIAYADAELGRLIAGLRDRWPGDTLWIVTSDHGESRGEHGEATHGHLIHDATQRVPLVMAGPGLPAGRIVEPPVRLADVAPTVRALAGLEARSDLDGRDLLPLLDGEDALRTAYFETLAPRLDLGWSALYGLRRGRFKLVRGPELELYDLEIDPHERLDLAASEPERTRRLDAELSERLSDAAPATPEAGLSPERRAQLASLGYLPAENAGEIVLGEVGGVHPRDGMPTLVRWMEGRALMMAGRIEEARAVLEATDLDVPHVSLDRAWAALRAGDGAAAERHARRAGDSGHAAQALGEALLVQGRLDEAEAALRAAAERLPSAGDPVAGMGRVAEARGRREEAAARYREAIARRGSSHQGVWRLAALEIEAGRPEQAEALLAELPEGEAARPPAAERLVRAEIRAGRREAARRRLAEALEHHPEADVLEVLREELAP